MAETKELKYDQLRRATFDVLSSLYSIGIASLSPQQRAIHQQQINEVYSAYLIIEANDYDALSAEALKLLPSITKATKAAQKSLEGLMVDAEVLKTVGSLLDVFQKFTKLFN
jgi:hypothetical protein